MKKKKKNSNLSEKLQYTQKQIINGNGSGQKSNIK